MGIGRKAHKLLAMIQKHGLAGLLIKYLERKGDREDQQYQKNWQSEQLTREEWQRQRDTRFPHMPLISVVVPAYETPEPFLRALVDSLQNQSYENWQLCIGDGSSSQRMQQLLEQLHQEDSRIVYCRLEENGGISQNTNGALALAQGSYVGFMDHDDCLAEDALYEVVRLLNQEKCRVIYTDEDKVDAHGTSHFRPHRKPDYNPELLRHYNYICHFVVVERELLQQLGGLRSAYDGSQDYDLLLRLSEQVEYFHHIPRILYHWRAHEQSTAGSSLSKDYAYTAGMAALQDYMDRNGIPARVEARKGRQSYEVRYQVSSRNIPLLKLGEWNRWEENLASFPQEDYVLIFDGSEVKKPGRKLQQQLFSNTAVEKAGMVGVRVARGGRLLAAGYDMTEAGQLKAQFSGLPVCFRGPFDRAVIPQNVDAVPLSMVLIHRRFLPALEELLGQYGKEDKQVAFALAEQIRHAGWQVVLDAEITVTVHANK